MKTVIVYETSTGRTAAAARAMGKVFEEHGHQCQVKSVGQADMAEVMDADLICVGAWVKGLFIIKQHPSDYAMGFIERLGDLAGKRVVVFCTYRLAAGSTLSQMTKALEAKGADVVGQFKYRGPEPNSAFDSFASSLT
jgi:flavodoxin